MTFLSEVVDPTYPGKCNAVQPPSPYPFPVSGNTLQTFKLTPNTLLHISCGGLIQKPDGTLEYTDMCYTVRKYFLNFWGQCPIQGVCTKKIHICS